MSIKEAIRNFTPSWFAASMSTGVVALVINGFPYDLPAQNQVGWAFWWLNVVLFSIFSLMFLGRLILFQSTVKPMLLHPVQSMFIGCIPMALATIVNGMVVFLNRYWDASNVATAAVVFFSIDVVLAALSSLLVPLAMFTLQHHSWERLTAVWLLPIVPGVVASASGGLVAQFTSVSTSQSIIYTCLCLWGLSVPLAFMLITLYLGRLAIHNLPPRELVVSSFLPVGPLAMSALALLHLSTAATRKQLAYGTASAAGVGTAVGVDTAGTAGLPLVKFGPILDEAGLVVALILWGAAMWWLAVAVITVLKTLRSGLPFNMGWWGFIFPTGVLTLATITLSSPAKLDSPTFRVIAACLCVVTIALWCMVVAYTVVFAARGNRLFVAPCLLEQAKQQQQQQQQEQEQEQQQQLARDGSIGLGLASGSRTVSATASATKCAGPAAATPDLVQAYDVSLDTAEMGAGGADSKAAAAVAIADSPWSERRSIELPATTTERSLSGSSGASVGVGNGDGVGIGGSVGGARVTNARQRTTSSAVAAAAAAVEPGL